MPENEKDLRSGEFGDTETTMMTETKNVAEVTSKAEEEARQQIERP